MRITKLLATAALLLLCGTASASWVTNFFGNPGGANPTMLVSFVPTNTPLVLSNGQTIYSYPVKAYATNGILSPTWLVYGPYTVTFGPQSDIWQITVPYDSNTYALWALVTNVNVVSNAASIPGVSSIAVSNVSGPMGGLSVGNIGSSYIIVSTNGGGGGGGSDNYNPANFFTNSSSQIDVTSAIATAAAVAQNGTTATNVFATITSLGTSGTASTNFAKLIGTTVSNVFATLVEVAQNGTTATNVFATITQLAQNGTTATNVFATITSLGTSGTASTNFAELIGTTITNWANATFSTGGSSSPFYTPNFDTNGAGQIDLANTVNVTNLNVSGQLNSSTNYTTNGWASDGGYMHSDGRGSLTASNVTSSANITAATNVTSGAFTSTNQAGTGSGFTGNASGLTNLNAAKLASGTVPTGRLGSGTASSSTYLRGDQTWATISGGSSTFYTPNFDTNGASQIDSATTIAPTNVAALQSISASNIFNADPNSWSNSFFGLPAGPLSVAAGSNMAFGDYALQNLTTGYGNIGIGIQAGQGLTIGYGNIFIGHITGFQNNGYQNTAVGFESQEKGGNQNNSSFGSFALADNAGFGNTALGAYAMYAEASSGSQYNVAVGYESLYQSPNPATLTNNTAVGAASLFSLNLGFTQTGNDNIALGFESGSNLISGTNNIYIGNTGVANETNQIHIGNLQTNTTIAGVINGNGAGLTNLNAAKLASGTVPTGRLASGTASSSTYLRGDQTWATVSGGITTNGSLAQNIDMLTLQGIAGAIGPVNQNLTYNEAMFGHLSQKLWTNGNVSWVWFGDSIGADTWQGMYNWLTTNTTQGVQPGCPFIGHGISFLYSMGTWTETGYSDPYYFWVTGSAMAVSAGSNMWYCGASGTPSYFYGNNCQLWYFSSASNGAASLNLTQNGSSWTSYPINEAAGTPEGRLIITNFPLTLGRWTAVVSNVSGVFRFPPSGFGIYNTNAGGGALLYDLNAPGLQLSDWLAMGSNNIVSIGTNIWPTVIEYDQIKPIAGYANYPQFFGYVTNTNFFYADILLGAGQPGDGTTGDPALTAAEAAFVYLVANTNNCAFWDEYTPTSVSNNVDMLNDRLNNPHLNAQGQQWRFQTFCQEIHLHDIWEANGQFCPPRFSGIATNGGTGYGTSFLPGGGVIAEPWTFSSVASFYPAVWWTSPIATTNWVLQDQHINNYDDNFWVNGPQLLNLAAGGTIFCSLHDSGGWEFGSGTGGTDPGVQAVAFRGTGNVTFASPVIFSNTITGNGVGLTNGGATLLAQNGAANTQVLTYSSTASTPGWYPSNAPSGGGSATTNFLHLHVTNQISFDGDGSTTGLELASGSQIYETSGSVLEELGIAGINLNGDGSGVSVQDAFTALGGATLGSAQVNNTLVVAGPVYAGQMLFTNTPTNIWFTTNVGPIYIASTAGTMIWTNSWPYAVNPGTNCNVHFKADLWLTFTASGSYGGGTMPIDVVATNYGGLVGGALTFSGSSAPGAATNPNTAAKTQMVVGATGYSIWTTNGSSAATREVCTITAGMAQ